MRRIYPAAHAFMLILGLGTALQLLWGGGSMPAREQIAVALTAAGSIAAACCVPDRQRSRIWVMVLRRLLSVLTIIFVVALAVVQHNVGLPWASPTMWILKVPMLFLLMLLIVEPD